MDSSAPSDDSFTEVTLPASFPPPGVTSNFINPVTRGPTLVITSAVCITLMVICITIRFYTKLYIKKTWGWDDCLCCSRLVLPALNSSRDMYTSYGKTVVIDSNLFLMVHDKIGSIGFAATSLSSKQAAICARPSFHSLTF